MNPYALLPDPGEPRFPAVTTPTPEPDALDRIIDLIGAHPTAAATVGITAAIATSAAVVALVASRRRNRHSGGKSDKLMTFFGAAVATGVVATGMWQFFGDVLHIDNPWMRAALFAFFEIGMLAEALRSRRFRLNRAQRADQRARERIERTKTGQSVADLDAADSDDRRQLDVDGLAVWALALMSGSFAAADQDTTAGVVLRLVAPIVAAWLWERGLAGELQQFRRPARRPSRINWTISPERVMVWLRLAEPTGREVNEIDRARRRAAFVTRAFRLHMLLTDGAMSWRIRIARWKLRRAGLDIMERFGVPELTAAQRDVATLYGIETGTAPDAVRHLTPWKPTAEAATDAARMLTAQPTPTVGKTDAGTVTGEVLPAAVTPSPRADVTPSPATATTDAPAGDGVTRHPSPRPAVTVSARIPSPRTTVTATVTPKAVTDADTINRSDAPASDSDGERQPSPRPAVTPSPSPAPTATNGTVARVSPLDRGVIDEQFRDWSTEKIEAHAALLAQQVATIARSKTAGMRAYFFTCMALGVDPKGSKMADAVGAAGSLGRTLAKKWHGELAVADAEQVIRDAYESVTADVTVEV